MGHPKPQIEYLISLLSIRILKLTMGKVAHPDYMDNQKIDSLYYLDKQLISPIDMIFEILIDDLCYI